MLDILAPFVYWAQTENQITLKIDLIDVKDVDVKLGEKKLEFMAHGKGARGPNNYKFTLDFHLPINKEESVYKVFDRHVDFIIRKKQKGWWQRLTGRPQKPTWLKIDFDRWQSEDTDDVIEDTRRDICDDYPEMYDKLEKEELGYRREEFKKVYLILYNLCQFIGFIYILSVMAIRYSRDGPEFIKDVYATVGTPFKFVQLLQFLEVLHPIFGYTKGSALVPLMQTCGRGFILFVMIETEPRMQTKPVVFFLFVVWSSVEVIRYPYYISQLLNVDIPLLTWLRYTIWMPLYPLGFLFEGTIVLRNIPYFEETQKFTVSLPNAWNFAFHFPSVLLIYLWVLLIPGIVTVMSHMRKARIQKLTKNRIKRID